MGAGIRLTESEQRRVEATQSKKDMEIAIQKLEQEKSNRDHIIRHLNDEIATQDEVINKLNKEKKHINENNAKANEDLQIAVEKTKHLSKIKTRLDVTLDELNDSLAREKRDRTDVEKQRRK